MLDALTESFKMEESRKQYLDQTKLRHAYGKERLIAYQKYFQRIERPVHLLRPIDGAIYRLAMILGCTSVGVCVWTIGRMSVNSLKKFY